MSTRDKSITDRGLVRLAGVRKRFLEGSRRTGRDDYTDHYALWNVDLEIDRGDVVGIIGQSGAGKTTLARVMLLLTRPSQGEVYYGRRRVDNLARHEVRELRRKFHLVFQDPDAALNPMMSVGQIMEEAIRLRTEIRGKKHIRDHGLTLLSGLELRDGTWDALPHQLSGGEKKRVAVARALLGRPDMILADEPFAGLDLAVAMRILNTLRRLRAEVGTALLFISHDIDIVLKASDRVAVLYRGRVLETGPSRQVSEAPQHPYTRFLLGLDRRVEPTAVSNPTCVFAHRCPQCLLCMNNGARKGMEPRYVPVGPDHLVLCHKAGQFPSKGRSPVDK